MESQAQGKQDYIFRQLKNIKRIRDISGVVFSPRNRSNFQFTKFLENYFPSHDIGIYTSTQTPLSRAKTWLNGSTGKTKIILGTRMAIFLRLSQSKIDNSR